MFLRLYYYLIVSCTAYPEIANETCPLNYTRTQRWLYRKIPGRLRTRDVYTETGLVPTGVLNPFRSIYTSYPDLVHLLCVTKSTALQPLNGPSAFSHEPLIHHIPMCNIHNHFFFSTTKRHPDIYKLLPILSCYNCYRTAHITRIYLKAYRNCFSWRTTDNPVCGRPGNQKSNRATRIVRNLNRFQSRYYGKIGRPLDVIQ